MDWLLAAFVLLAALALAITLLLGARRQRRWRSRSSALIAKLNAEPGPAGVTHFDPAELIHLPAPVQRYLRIALTAGQPLVRGVRLTQSGFLNLSAAGDRWQPFTAEQQVATRGPGFLWNARVGLFSGLSVRVQDSYLAGAGLLHAALLGVLDMARQQGGGELARGELMRFLAEAPWYPTALLPSQGVSWAAVDARQADATLADGTVSVTLRFKFGDAGLVDTVRAEARGRKVGRMTEMAPWEGRWKEWTTRDGMRVPLAGEVAWLLLSGRQTYWRGRLGKLRYRFSA
ncbi:DUF6920 family protein [Roseateles sp. P5_E1]